MRKWRDHPSGLKLQNYTVDSEEIWFWELRYKRWNILISINYFTRNSNTTNRISHHRLIATRI